MDLIINGNHHPLAGEGLTVSQVLEQLALEGRVLVEHNGQALFARELPQVIVQDGDRLELILVAAGG